MLRRIRRSLRDIRRYSKPKSPDVLDRVQEWAFIAAFLIAPVVAWGFERGAATITVEKQLLVRVYLKPDATKLEGSPADPRDTAGRGWTGVTPMAEIGVQRTTHWFGWPLAMREERAASELVTTLLPSCPESRRTEAEAVARKIAEDRSVYFARSETRLHYGSWIFSSAAWWMIIVFAVALALVPIRIGRIARKRVRNAIRQGRIARSRCPNCGYDVRRTVIRGFCPECGSEIYERPEY